MKRPLDPVMPEALTNWLRSFSIPGWICRCSL